MKASTRNKVVVSWICFSSIVLSLIVFTEAKGGSGGGGGRGGGGRSGGSYAYGGSRGGRISGKKLALGAAAVGVAGYAVYHNQNSVHRFHSNSLDNPAFASGGGGATRNSEEEDYKIQESSYYNRGEGFGMSAFGLIALILGIIGMGTLMWYCMEICIPLWRDRQANRSRQAVYSKEGHPLQETPSTATPSP